MKTPTQKQIEEREHVASELIHDLAEVGRMWATHGLRVGQSALQTAAKTLETTAKTLSDLSDRVER